MGVKVKKSIDAYQLCVKVVNGRECLVLFNGINFEIWDKEDLREILEFAFCSYVNIDAVNDLILEENDKLNNLSEESLKSLMKPVKRNLGFIYVIKCNRTNLYKIGRTINISARFKQLKTANPDISLIAHYEVRDTSIEDDLHFKFHHKRIDGEWFELSETELNLINEHVKKFNDEV